MTFDFKEIVEHEIQLKKVDLIKINCDYDGKDVTNKESSTNISVNVKGETIDETSGYSYIHIIAINEVDGFKFEMIQRGLFISENDMIDKKVEFEKFLAVQGIRILWSYVRETLYDISCRMLGKPFVLPTLDVMKTLTNANEKED